MATGQAAPRQIMDAWLWQLSWWQLALALGELLIVGTLDRPAEYCKD